MNEVFQEVPTCQLQESRTNPRRHFDEAGLAELAASIKEHGIINALLVRPLAPPMEPEEQRQRDERASKRALAEGYEVVCGARRLRAARAAGIEMIPVRVREMTDAEILEIQVIENLQREDVHPLDEAHGYSRLMEGRGYTIAEMAARVGRSEPYIHQRLQLHHLIEPAQKALWEDRILLGHALLIARLDPDDQKQALENAIGGQYREPVSVGRLREWIQREVLLSLGAAAWCKDDAELVAKAGACRDCTRRTGAQAALFPEIAKGDHCLDRTCYAAKQDAWIPRALAETDDQGRKPLQVSTSYQTPPEGVLDANEYRAIAKKADRCEHARGAIVVAGQYRGMALDICPKLSQCAKHWKGYGGDSYRQTQRAEEKKRRERMATYRQAGERVLTRIFEIAAGTALGEPGQRILHQTIAERTDDKLAKRLCKARSLEPVKTSWGGDNWRAALVKAMSESSAAEIAADALHLVLLERLEGEVNAVGRKTPDAPKIPLLAEAAAFGLDAKVVTPQVTAARKAKRAKKPSKAKAGAAAPAKSRRKSAPKAKARKARGGP